MNMVTMKVLCFLCVLGFVCSVTLAGNTSGGTTDGSEAWGYIEVRPQAHMFWWLYKSPKRVEVPSKPWPTILWLQGGPGGSGVGFGNFGEIGPLDVNLKPRNSTWLEKADLLFVDSPVGTGYSYVEDDNLFVKTDVDAATDVTTLLKAIYNGNATLQNSPLYIFAESYGGKFAVTLGLSVLEAIQKSELKLQLGGVALGDSWISPEDFVVCPLFSLALKIQQQLADGQYVEATSSWHDLEQVISDNSNGVDFYNFMLDEQNDPNIATTNTLRRLGKKDYTMILETDEVNLDTVMNGPIRQKLKIIPANVTWGGQKDSVFEAMEGDFMRPRIAEVDELLSKGVNVTVYNGQIDLICATKGTEAWINKLKWDGLSTYLNLSRTPLYCGKDRSTTKAFVKSYKNFAFYWILGAGHFQTKLMVLDTSQVVRQVTTHSRLCDLMVLPPPPALWRHQSPKAPNSRQNSHLE
ncbi:serine carboxypeptidase-like 51 [Artemisia annua]|uniref:Carboxypeptidase n=1 Tax=Artemisia annua TaxID=35608 RepID=A0A2U1KGE4_ARTAN|nr:serine carboxypeptidase-like 51 [Artemisia annua]